VQTPTALDYLSLQQFEDRHVRQTAKPQPDQGSTQRAHSKSTLNGYRAFVAAQRWHSLNQAARVGVHGTLEYPVCVPAFHDPALVHHDDVIT
jgi:hypothetical protein